MELLLLTIAFVPVSVFAAVRIFQGLRPAKHRSLTFVAGGVFTLLLGAMSGFALRSNLQAESIGFHSRYLGGVHATSAEHPVEYWGVVLALYAVSVLLAGFGLAVIGGRGFLAVLRTVPLFAGITVDAVALVACAAGPAGGSGASAVSRCGPAFCKQRGVAPAIGVQTAARRARQDAPPGMHSMALQLRRAQRKAPAWRSIGGRMPQAGVDLPRTTS